LACARELKGQVPSSQINRPGIYGVTFDRSNGSGSQIAYSKTDGAWLLAAGTWFFEGSYGSGAEEHLLSEYCRSGLGSLTRGLEGFFVMILGNPGGNGVTVVTDIVGSCHCYIREVENGVALAGSSLILASLGAVELDTVGCQEYLNTGIIYEDRSIYRSIKKIGPATILSIEDGTIKDQRRYWTVGSIVPESLEGSRAVEVVSGAIVRAAKIVGKVFNRPVCDLTGGFDSRTMVAGFLVSRKPFSTTVSGSGSSKDVVISKELAAMEGLPHLWIEGNPPTFEHIKKAFRFTDGEYDLVDYARILSVHENLSEQYDISINGSFGEVGRGYWWELLFPHAGSRRRVNAELLARKRYAAFPYNASLIDRSVKLDMVSHFTEVIERLNVHGDDLPNTLQLDSLYLELRMQRWQGKIASSTDQLWPCLSPLLFRSVIEAMLQTATWQRRRNLLIRQVILSLAPRYAERPLEHGYPALPINWKTLAHFWPLLPYYGRRVFRKVSVKFGRGTSPTSPESAATLTDLWEEEGVQEIFHVPARNLQSCLDVNVPAFRDFVDASKRPNFPYAAQWGRVLSLEYTLQELRRFSTIHPPFQ
jgi:asparagine synthase (glutamine-hydrolysing)